MAIKFVFTLHNIKNSSVIIESQHVISVDDLVLDPGHVTDEDASLVFGKFKVDFRPYHYFSLPRHR